MEGNFRIDQLVEGVPKLGDWGVFRSTDDLKTKRYSITGSDITQNFEWITDNNPGYAINDIVTYGGNIYQSLIDDNLNIVPGSDPTKWQLLTRGLNWSRWAAGTFLEDDVFVIRLIDGEDHICQLMDAARPYVSSNFTTEFDAGDWKSLTQNEIVKDATVAAGTVELDVNNLKKRTFKFADVIGEAKTWSILKGSNAIKLNVTFELSTLDLQTFPATFNVWTLAGFWDGATNIWTPTDLGKYEMEITYNGVYHSVKIFGPFYN